MRHHVVIEVLLMTSQHRMCMCGGHFEWQETESWSGQQSFIISNSLQLKCAESWLRDVVVLGALLDFKKAVD